MKQTGEAAIGFVTGFIRYTLQFRGYRFFVSEHVRYVSLTLFLNVTAFPPAELPAFIGTTPLSDYL
jgi:hypothetical protein